MRAKDKELEEEILRLLAERGAGKTICPSEAARAVGGEERAEWEPLMEPARAAGGGWWRGEDRDHAGGAGGGWSHGKRGDPFSIALKSCADGEGFVLCGGTGGLGRRPRGMATKKKAAKKSSGEGQACWPGFKRVPGTKAGTKGSCEPKASRRLRRKRRIVRRRRRGSGRRGDRVCADGVGLWWRGLRLVRDVMKWGSSRFAGVAKGRQEREKSRFLVWLGMTISFRNCQREAKAGAGAKAEAKAKADSQRE